MGDLKKTHNIWHMTQIGTRFNSELILWPIRTVDLKIMICKLYSDWSYVNSEVLISSRKGKTDPLKCPLKGDLA